ncbi:hypothetical protein [Membranihabitans marinus]|uniref:hypothetical protein n=1 Tax=Membranihabitans marinus TaxID=1227546 RepID=UPI001F3C019D|nr:hypothetical protein [Membranihabitans marinus]
MQKIYITIFIGFILGLIFPSYGQESPMEEDFFEIKTLAVPEGILLEVGGVVVLPDGNLGLATRRGDVYIVENPYSRQPHYRKFASGLHEILGLVWKDNSFYCVQRSELTRLEDTDLDGKADIYETFAVWPITGNYHEYSYGPVVAPDGSFYVTTNVGFWGEQWWRGDSRLPWRGWTLRITADGQVHPWATGMRSPAGPGIIDGEFFYTENQGDWIGSGGLWHIEEGDFSGNPAGLKWAHLPNSPVDLTYKDFVSKIDIRENKRPDGRYIKPENVVKESYQTAFDVEEIFPAMKLPAVWLPHGILGISSAQPLEIPEENFGPFGGQILVGDQGMSMISRIMLEKVNGVYQGAAIAFRSGFQSGVLRMDWAQDGSLFVGETNRGWGSAGDADEGLQRLVWNGETPFEMKNIKAMADGFEIEFTLPVDPVSAKNPDSYDISNFIYKYHPVYGSPPVDESPCTIESIQLSDDGMKVRLVLNNLKEHYIHTISLPGLRDKNHFYSLVHPTAYYTLNSIPGGGKINNTNQKVSMAKGTGAVIQKDKPVNANEHLRMSDITGQKKVSAEAYINLDQVNVLLTKYTCIACHDANKRKIGPSYKAIAKRKYSNNKIVELIHQPQPQNWPGYATEMPPMSHVPTSEALKIAEYINSLTK